MQTTKETTPDELMEHFKGRSLKSIIIFTLVVHAVIVIGTSIPYLLRTLTGSNSEGLSEEERKELALKEATASLQQIAKEHGIRPQELSNQLAGGAKPAAAPTDSTPTEETPATPADPADDPADPKSSIEMEIEVAEPGPTAPPVEVEDDLFK